MVPLEERNGEPVAVARQQLARFMPQVWVHRNMSKEIGKNPENHSQLDSCKFVNCNNFVNLPE